MKEYVCHACGNKVAFHSEFNDFWCPACGAMHISTVMGEWQVSRPTNQIFRDIESDRPPPKKEVEYVCLDTGRRGFGLTGHKTGKVYDSMKAIEYGAWRPINPGDPEEKKE